MIADGDSRVGSDQSLHRGAGTSGGDVARLLGDGVGPAFVVGGHVDDERRARPSQVSQVLARRRRDVSVWTADGGLCVGDG